MKTLRIGTRGSKLARWQAEHTRQTLLQEHEELNIEIILIKSQGDQKQEQSIASLGAVGIFTREIEQALQDGRIDLAVHSLKDLPTRSPEDLSLAAVLPRDDPRDALISPSLVGFDPENSQMALSMLPRSASVGTSSLRRQAELLRRRPDLRIVEVRGNVPTRLEKLQQGELEAIVLSLSGLQRLQLEPPGCVRMDPQLMLPAPAQGTIALQTRKEDTETTMIVRAINHRETEITTTTERILLQDLEGGCRIPMGALATIDKETIRLSARILMADGSEFLEHVAEAPVDKHKDLAHEVANHLFERGARRMLQERNEPR